MGELILSILLQYVVVGLICAVFIDFSIRLSRSSDPFTFIEILGTIIAWPVVVGNVVTLILKDFFN